MKSKIILPIFAAYLISFVLLVFSAMAAYRPRLEAAVAQLSMPPLKFKIFLAVLAALYALLVFIISYFILLWLAALKTNDSIYSENVAVAFLLADALVNVFSLFALEFHFLPSSALHILSVPLGTGAFFWLIRKSPHSKQMALRLTGVRFALYLLGLLTLLIPSTAAGF